MPGIIGSSAGMNRTVIGQRMRPPSSRLPTPIVTEAHNDAEAMSTPHCISAKRRGVPDGGQQGDDRKGPHRRVGNRPETDGGHGGEQSVGEHVERDHSRADFTIISVPERPMAMQTMSISADVRRAMPFRMCPLDNVDHAVDERHAGNEEQDARGDGDVRRGVERERHRSVHRGDERRGDEDHVVVEAARLHSLLEEKSR